MSGKNNVNPDHYKVAGRDRPNEVLVAEPRVPGEGAYLPPAKGRRPPNFIPGALPVGEAPPPRPRTTSTKADDSVTRSGTGAKTGERAAEKPRKRPAAKATARRGAGAKGRATSGGAKAAASARAKAARKRTTRTVTARKRSASPRRKRTTTR